MLLKTIWFSTVIDSYGNLPKSYTWGNYFWFSSQELCDDLNDPFKITISGRNPKHGFLNQTSPFPVEFRMMYYGFESPAYVDLKLQFEVSWVFFHSHIHILWLGSTALLTLNTIAWLPGSLLFAEELWLIVENKFSQTTFFYLHR